MTYKKLIKYLAIFANIRDKLNLKSKYLLYNALIQSILSYNVIVARIVNNRYVYIQ